MKKIMLASLVTLVGLSANAQTVAKKTTVVKKPTTTLKTPSKITANKTPLFKNTLDSASYALGINVASSFKNGGLNTINYELFNKGIKDVFAKANPTLTQEQCQTVINNLFTSFNKQKEDADKQKYSANVNAGAAFLAQNKTKPGIKTTASGLQYEVIVQGTGVKPTASDVVTVNYKGTLLDGFEFDSSYKRGEPATFGLDRVISGWTEGVQLMEAGSKYRFFIPYNLAYGGRATPDGSIPPFSTLIFEIELIKIGE
ncbi:FKBP-type peptidyl-prolyl cis-trans isomerase [Pedobacter sp. LMG 31464]|uniref:Peptidyl-prolyl cis-trans isomerase n=1 Tax=Pedobacter planticolens TaxID=2679964 RepID=A0A923IWW0_9SPHI|nr:FKBP-type peptidyl-prolyl cis-trans isomerase [Pedobacter planticolens]MBB2145632.1 FKBP-type peptidyl-prolyl cis-trans isomerase [Pedobacter planticolens]